MGRASTTSLSEVEELHCAVQKAVSFKCFARRAEWSEAIGQTLAAKQQRHAEDSLSKAVEAMEQADASEASLEAVQERLTSFQPFAAGCKEESLKDQLAETAAYLVNLLEKKLSDHDVSEHSVHGVFAIIDGVKAALCERKQIGGRKLCWLSLHSLLQTQNSRECAESLCRPSSLSKG